MPRKKIKNDEIEDNPFESSNRRVKSFTYFVFSTFVIVSLLGILHQPVLEAYAKWFAYSEEDPTSDMAVVIDTQPERLESAISLLKRNKVKSIYVNAISSIELKNLISKYQLPAEKVYWGGCRVVATFDQPIAFKKTLLRHNLPYRSIVIVSEPYHLRRSSWTYHHILHTDFPDFKIKTHPSFDKKTVFDKWWEDEYSRNWVSSETQKLVFYWLNYGLLNKTEMKDVNDIEFNDVFRQAETRYKPSDQLATCGNDPY